MCGGTSLTPNTLPSRAGLSPRVRGNPKSCRRTGDENGSIPACAGEPRRLSPPPTPTGVYPRVCGGPPPVSGSPASTTRSIPACAGEPGRVAGPPGTAQVYPRVCGGTRHQRNTRLRAGGLSPRVRGNRQHRQTPCYTTWSIPACAGEPTAARVVSRLDGVYPRVCGGTCCARFSSSISSGLSPRVRGNPSCATTTPVISRSIPACAGEPSAGQSWRQSSGVYPRVCGGTLPKFKHCIVVLGLSPRVRGNPLPARPYVCQSGSIPACAGEPIRRR